MRTFYADILIGTGGKLHGLAGGDLLFAGALAATLSKDNGEDLVVSGTTILDRSAPVSALATWSDARTADSARLASLCGLLASTKVTANGCRNHLLGGADAFLTSTANDTTDVEDRETVLALQAPDHA